MVVEYNGDVYPCDFFVESDWKLGNVNAGLVAGDRTPPEALPVRRQQDARRTRSAQVCEYSRCATAAAPSTATTRAGSFEDLDYFCEAYKMIFAKARPAEEGRGEAVGAAGEHAGECRT